MRNAYCAALDDYVRMVCVIFVGKKLLMRYE